MKKAVAGMCSAACRSTSLHELVFIETMIGSSTPSHAVMSIATSTSSPNRNFLSAKASMIPRKCGGKIE